MSQLLRRGYIAALAPAGVPNCDILVSDVTGDSLVAIQVKTRRNLGKDGGWHMSRKHEELRSQSLIYCFVDFGKTPSDQPASYVVPASVVADALQISHRAWLGQPGAKGQARNDSDFRRLLPCYAHLELADVYNQGWLEPYRDNWPRLAS